MSLSPAVLEITTMVGCPVNCTFCPQDALKSAYGKSAVKYMSLDTFSVCLSKLPKHVRVDFSGMAEPWANPDCTKMLELTLERGYRVAIYTTLYGISVFDSAHITTNLLPKFKSQIDHIVLHLPDEKMNMRGYKPSEEYRQVLKNFISAGQAHRLPLSAMTMDKMGQLHPSLRDLVHRLPGWNGHSRAGSLGEEQTAKVGASKPPRRDGRVKCGVTDFYDHNVLLPSGDVLLCCMDYGKTTVLANLLKQDYWDIFSSPVLTKLRIENQKPGFSKCSICKSCDCSVAV